MHLELLVWNSTVGLIYLSIGQGCNGFKLKEGRFRLDTRRKFFTLRVVSPWPGMPREAVAAPSLPVFKAGLEGL